jgi:hypothetical protein
LEDTSFVANRDRIYAQIFAAVLLVVVLSSIHPVAALTEGDVRAELATAYEAVARAEAVGGNVTGLVSQLDYIALNLPGASPNSLMVYKSWIDLILTMASNDATQGRQRITNRFIFVGVALAVIATLCVVVWTRGSRWFWGAWLRAHSGWRVERI